MSLHSALQLRKIACGWEISFYSPAVTGRDWQEGNNVRLSGNIGKGGGYGQYHVVAVTAHAHGMDDHRIK
jgi:hypothetical protein